MAIFACERSGTFLFYISSFFIYQDPIELNHNVAAGVSKHFLSMIRWKLMFSISLLKKHPDDLTNLFELKEFNDVKAVGGSGINKNGNL